MIPVNLFNSNTLPSDEALVLATGQGDLQAFAEVVRRHQQWAWQIALRFLGDEYEAADVVQDGFLRVLAAAKRYQPTAKFRTYFYGVITRLCMDRAKKKQPCFMETIPESQDVGTGAMDTLIQEETARCVRRSLDQLPPCQRMAIVLRYYEDLSYKEIALALDTTPKSVERLLSRARKGLKSCLGEKE